MCHRLISLVAIAAITLVTNQVTAQVSDTTPPTLRLVGNQIIWLPLGVEYVEPGATCLDSTDGNISGTVDIEHSVNTAVSGVYTVTYNCADTAGNEAPEIFRLVAIESQANEPLIVGLDSRLASNGRYGVLAALTAPSEDFTVDDLSLVNATVPLFEAFERFARFILQPISDGEFSVSVPAGVITDINGNPNLASNALVFLADSGPPDVELSSAAPAVVNGPIQVTVELSEASSDFAAADITLTNSSVSAFTGADSSYAFTLTPNQNGIFNAVVNAGAFTDAAGNANTASNVLSREADLSDVCFYKMLFQSEWPLLLEDIGIDEHTGQIGGPGKIPQRWAVAMVRQVLCRPSHPWHHRTLEVLDTNVTAIENEPPEIATQVAPYKHVLAALLLVNQGRQSFFKSEFGLTGEYETVRGKKRNNGTQPFSDGEDLDEDGHNNVKEYENVLLSGGTMDDFAEAVSDPRIRGLVGISSSSALGLTYLTIVLSALGAYLARKNRLT